MALDQLVETTGQAQKKRRRPAKPVKPNDDVGRYYRTQLRSLVRAMRRAVDDEVMPVIKAEKADYTGDATPAMDDWAARVTAALQRVAERFVSASFEAMYRRMARNVVERTENQTTERLTKSVNQAVGVDITPMLSESDMNDFVTASIENNVSLIKSFPEEYFKRVEGTIYRGMLDGVTPSSIASQIAADTGVSERRAKQVARDQVGSITSQVTERRQKQAGIKYYQSIDAGDERVSGRPGGRYPNARISCWGIARRDIGYGPGVYLISEGASWGGETGLHPGRHHPLCRCVSKPVFDFEVEGD